MKKAMLEQWDNPARINELCMCLDTLPCKGSISEYAQQFQEIEAQILLKDMSPGNHIYKFITHLPLELYMTLIPQTDQQDISYFYSAAWIWEGLQKIPQKLAATLHPGPSKFLRKFRPPPPLTQSATTMPYLLSASASLISDPMDLDAMSIGHNPHKPPSTAPRRATPVPALQEHFCQVKSMHLLEEEGEGEDEDIDGVYDPETFDPEEGNAEEYDPHKPDLELQYLVNKANLMEQKKELTKEEERAEEEDLFQIMHAYCNYCEGCSDWSTCLPGANKWKPGSPDHDDDDWQPQSPDEAYLKALCCWASSTTPPPGLGEERPEEMHYITHSNLPVYQTEIGPLKILSLTAVSACIPMKTILDTGAESNYIAAKKAREAGMQIFPIAIREIVGAGQTTTSAFAMFTLNIGRILTQCYAYVLDNTMQF
ncbi:hypothetical protein V8E53_014918 [Lactarius tabidus]